MITKDEILSYLKVLREVKNKGVKITDWQGENFEIQTESDKKWFSELEAVDLIYEIIGEPECPDPICYSSNKRKAPRVVRKAYEPLTDYKTGINDLRMQDDPFEITFDEDSYKPVTVEGCGRGKWKIVDIPYGFGLLGFGTEDMIVVQFTSGQSGTTKIMVTMTQVDLGQNVFVTHVSWDEIFVAINDLINRAYFAPRGSAHCQTISEIK